MDNNGKTEKEREEETKIAIIFIINANICLEKIIDRVRV